MKQIALTCAFCLIAFLSYGDGSPIMVCNPAGTVCAPYTNIDSAYTHANPGDYIYLPGGIFNMNAITISKEIHLIGAGHDFDSSMVTNMTTINGNIYLSDLATNSSLEGMYITGSIFGPTQSPISNLQINYCHFHLIECFMTNSILHACILRSNGSIDNKFYGGDYNEISNCYISNITSLNSSTISNCVGLSIANNIILTTLKNNILAYYPYSPFGQPGSNNSMNNNIFVASCPYYCLSAINYSNNTQLIVGDLFVNGFDYHNMHLVPNSPGLTAGQNGTQVGVYGGLIPYKEGAIPSNPHVFKKIISASTNSSGLLPVQISVRAENH